MKIETLQIKDLTPDPQNARQHDDKNLKAIQGSLKEFGQRKPIVITEAGVIVAGNGTVEAAKRLGWTKIDAVRVPGDWTPEQTKAFALADNRTAELAAWNTETLTAQLQELEEEGWEIANFGFEALEFPGEDKPIVEDEVPESAPQRSSLGDVWQLGRHRLMVGSSTDIKTVQILWGDKSPDLVVTDPPYGIDVVSSSKSSGSVGGAKSFGTVEGSNVIKANAYSPIIGDSTTTTAKEFFQVCQELSFENYLIWGGNYFTDFLQPKKCWIVWDKKGRKWDDNFSDFEMAWTSYDKPAKIITQVWMGMVQGGEREKRVHPTQKPAKLIADCLEYLHKEAKLIYDGFLGSGSTLIACEQTDRTCYGMELDPKYCDVIIARWETLTGQTAQLLSKPL
jgi:DNA modification methylase